jgi:hypothetical protein
MADKTQTVLYVIQLIKLFADLPLQCVTIIIYKTLFQAKNVYNK